MSANGHRFHLAELEAARHHLARSKELIEEQKGRISRLIRGSGRVSSFDDQLNKTLRNLIERELEQEE